MRASLDTNAIIHFYKAGLQDILFDFFDEGVFIYEQIRKIELENQTINDFNSINIASNLNWSFRRQLIKFIKRFFEDPYRNEDTEWIKKLAVENNINIKQKFQMLRKIL